MGCCKSSESVVSGTPNQQSLLVAEHDQHNQHNQKQQQQVGLSRPQPPEKALGAAAALAEEQRPPGPSATVSQSSPIPVAESPGPGESTPKEAFANAMSPGNSSTSSWDGEGAGVWRVCNGDVSPNPLSSIMEERNAEEEEARAAMAALVNGGADGTDGDSPFFRSVASAEVSPAEVAAPMQDGRTKNSPGVLSGIMQEKALNGGNIARNPMLGNQDLSPPLDGSPFFRSVSSVDGAENEKDDLKNHPLSLGFDMDDGEQVWRDSRGALDSENLAPA